MRAVLQRVAKAEVLIGNDCVGSIGHGLLVLLGIEAADEQADVVWLSRKIVQMRIFSDEQGQMNRSLLDTKGSILLVSQFTLHAATRKGNRPSFVKAAKPEQAIPLYEAMLAQLASELGRPVSSGRFGADMQVHLVNDGPVTIIIDSREGS
jgi:D-tyrosyl-tRNA(Tyr) deacylase